MPFSDYAVQIFQDAISTGHHECYLRPDTRLPMMYMADFLRAVVEFLTYPDDQLTLRTYNIQAISFTPAELADAIKAVVPNFKISYRPDSRQQIGKFTRNKGKFLYVAEISLPDWLWRFTERRLGFSGKHPVLPLNEGWLFVHYTTTYTTVRQLLDNRLEPRELEQCRVNEYDQVSTQQLRIWTQILLLDSRVQRSSQCAMAGNSIH